MPLRSPGRVFWPLAGLLVLVDCSSKRVIEDVVPLAGGSVSIIDDFVRLTLAYNQGAAFSTHLGPYQRWVLIGTSLTVLVVLARSYRAITGMGLIATAGLAFTMGGAAGNMLDRLISDRGVVDFIDVGVRSWRFYLFNAADAGVAIGAALLALAFWRSDRAPGTGAS